VIDTIILLQVRGAGRDYSARYIRAQDRTAKTRMEIRDLPGLAKYKGREVEQLYRFR